MNDSVTMLNARATKFMFQKEPPTQTFGIVAGQQSLKNVSTFTTFIYTFSLTLKNTA